MDEHMLLDESECGIDPDADLDGPGGGESRAGGPLGGHHPSSAGEALHGDSLLLKAGQGTASNIAAIKAISALCQCSYIRATRKLSRGFKIALQQATFLAGW
jgi:hypothetical protein